MTGGKGLSLESVLNEAARPKLKLFLSADIVGSTAYKQSQEALPIGEVASRDWAKHIQQFYTNFSDDFRKAWKSLKVIAEASGADSGLQNTNEGMFGPSPVFWKTVGDEVLFWKELQSEHQIWLTLSAWMEAVAKSREWLKRHGLDVKSTAWTAGFPVFNRVIANPQFIDTAEIAKNQTIEKRPGEPEPLYNPAQVEFLESKKTDLLVANAILVDVYYKTKRYGQYIDFIGPNIDLGFRISNHSSTRRMTISTDLAYLMAKSGTSRYLIRFDPVFEALDIEGRLENIGRLCEASEGDTLTMHFGKLSLYYSGMTKLKGVLGEVDYPRFWVNTEQDESLDYHKSELWGGVLSSLGWTTVGGFSDAFFKDRKNYTVPPFIHEESLKGETDTSYDSVLIDPRINKAKGTMGFPSLETSSAQKS